MDELFPIIMDMLQDSSSLAKRQVCSFPYVKLLIHCYLLIFFLFVHVIQDLAILLTLARLNQSLPIPFQ